MDGEIDINGTHYNYVKRRVNNDTLYLLCIPNQAKTRLLNSKCDYAKQVSDSPASEKNSKSAIKKVNLAPEYNRPINNYGLVAPLLNIDNKAGFFIHQLPDRLPNARFRPPRLPLALA